MLKEEGLDDIVSWVNDTTFEIHDTQRFFDNIMKKFFPKQNFFNSFQQQ